MSTRSLLAQATQFAALLAAASLVAEADLLRTVAALRDARALVAVVGPWTETVATDAGWPTSLDGALCDLYGHAHSALRAACPGDAAIVADAADEWDARHPDGVAFTAPAACFRCGGHRGETRCPVCLDTGLDIDAPDLGEVEPSYGVQFAPTAVAA